MKYAIISDVHANPAALKAVLSDVRQQKADRVICLGDVTGYGYDALEAYDLIKEYGDVWLLGNHDAACAGVDSDVLTRENPHYDTDIAARKELGRARLSVIRQLPYTFSDGVFVCTHGDFVDPRMFDYILSADDARLNFAASDKALMFIGHTHEAKVWVENPSGELETFGGRSFPLRDGYRYIVNVGSVGYPRHDFFSSYAIFDSDNGTVNFRKLDFDFAGYIEEFAKRNLTLPPWLNILKNLEASLFGKRVKKRRLKLRKT